MRILLVLFAVGVLASYGADQSENEDLTCSDLVEILKLQKNEDDVMIPRYKEFLEFVCKTTEDKCEEYKENLPFILHLIWKKLDTPSICSALEKMHGDTKHFCIKCRHIVNVIQYHTFNVSENERSKYGEWFCKLVSPTSMQPSLCNAFMGDNRAISWMEARPHAHICQQAGFCLSKQNDGDIPPAELDSRHHERPLLWKIKDVLPGNSRLSKDRDLFIKLDEIREDEGAEKEDLSQPMIPATDVDSVDVADNPIWGSGSGEEDDNDDPIDTSLPQYDYSPFPLWPIRRGFPFGHRLPPFPDHLIPDPPADLADSHEEYPEGESSGGESDGNPRKISSVVDEEFPEDITSEKNSDPFGDSFAVSDIMENLNEMHSKLKPKFNIFGRKINRLFKDMMGSNWMRQGLPFPPGKLDEILGNINNQSAMLKNGNISFNFLCFSCERIVDVIQFQITIANSSLEFIEKEVEKVCEALPISSKDCQTFVDKLDMIVQLIEHKVSPKGICDKLGFCKKQNLTDGLVEIQSSISSVAKCSPLCNFMKNLHEDGIRKTTGLWNTTRNKLETFCGENKIFVKCKRLIATFEKATTQLDSIEAEQEEGHCNCFQRQPVLDTKEFDPCIRCKQFHKGIVNELQAVNETIQLLALSIVQLCEVLDEDVQEECMVIADEFGNSFDHLEKSLEKRSNVCPAIGYCRTNEEKKKIFQKQIKKYFGNIKNPFSGMNPFLIRGAPIGFRRFSPSCLFCKDCMLNLEKTLSKVNESDVTRMFPAIKEGFSMSCETRAIGDEMTTVCKKISNGMETVYKVMKKRRSGEGTCKMLGVC